MDLTYALLDGEKARLWLPQLVDLYAVVYAEPPYEEGPEQVAEFAETVPGDLDADGFTLAAAFVNEHLAGAAYGVTMAAGRWWKNTDDEPPAEVRDAAKFAVMEWMVRPANRITGVGRSLIRLLLADRPEPWAVLASDPRSTARSMYERAGWRQVGRSHLSWGPAMDLLVLPLTSPSRPNAAMIPSTPRRPVA
ncbi:N-acetyltransferase [Phytohabitans houttuyneae]|uniref:N-acetyltransferase n=1 Tax=Phytohabitans houttuyneae TaxID=1076126 RepID=UPI001FE77BA8|nr:N-acetyltransferase [Phytohabitans houttuyneae]